MFLSSNQSCVCLVNPSDFAVIIFVSPCSIRSIAILPLLVQTTVAIVVVVDRERAITPLAINIAPLGVGIVCPFIERGRGALFSLNFV